MVVFRVRRPGGRRVLVDARIVKEDELTCGMYQLG